MPLLKHYCEVITEVTMVIDHSLESQYTVGSHKHTFNLKFDLYVYTIAPLIWHTIKDDNHE